MIRRLALAALILIVVVGCRSAREEPAHASLAANMAEIEQHMNQLFRHIDQPEKLPELHAATVRMLQLQTASTDLAPGRDSQRIRQFKLRSQQAVDIMLQLQNKLKKGQLDQAREQLLILDRQRRECHSIFG